MAAGLVCRAAQLDAVGEADAPRLVRRLVELYSTQRSHSGIGYITPQDKLEGRKVIVCAHRKRKLAEARA